MEIMENPLKSKALLSLKRTILDFADKIRPFVYVGVKKRSSVVER